MRTSSVVLAPDSFSGITPKPQQGKPQGVRPAVVEEIAADPPPPKIVSFEQKLGGRRHEERWARTPNVTGTGAIHVKSFHGKLNDDSLGYLDQQINEWLDAHPQYEVKFVTSSVGEWQGKMGREYHLVLQVWV
jgi:hypothetical protein